MYMAMRSVPYVIKFAIKHEPGSLARALKVLEVSKLIKKCLIGNLYSICI